MKQKIKQTLMVIVGLLLSTTAFSHNFEVNGIYYNYLDKTAKTVKVTYKGGTPTEYSDEYTGAVAIPSSVTYSGTTYSVTSIGNRAFYDCDGLTEVTIPNSVTKIAYEAFEFCDDLTSVSIGNSVTTIGNEAFYSCTRLAEVNISDLSSWCKIDFYNNYSNPLYYAQMLKLNGSEITNLVIPNDITEIKNYAFYNCDGLTSVTIPNSVTSIGDDAFFGCTGLTSVTIGNSVTSIGENAFYNTGWYNNQPEGILYLDNCCLGYKGNEPTGALSIKEGTRLIGSRAFYYCDGLTEVTIPNSVTSIGDDAFDYCSRLTEVNISDLSAWCKIDFGNSYSNPLYYAQKLKLNGSEITNLVIPNDITQIKQYAFFYCNGLTSVTIPNSVTSIGESAFYYCPGLTSVTIPNSVTKIDNMAFRNCDLRLIMSHCAIPPTCDGVVFGVNGNDNYSALLMIPEGSLIDYALADEWHKFTQVHEVSEASVSTQEKNATFEIPTIEGAAKYDITVYSDITMTQLVATTHYDAIGKIIPMSTTLELSIDGFDNGVYYYKVMVKSKTGETLNSYIGTFEIKATMSIEDIATDKTFEVARYDIHGRLLSEPARGINIVKYSDGTTRKEIIK